MIDVPVQAKDALKEGAYKKNYRFVVLNDDDTEDFTIDNENLVSESVGIDERMCSGDVIKFGLCEGSSLEFQYFGKQNITGREIQAFVDVDYEAYGTSYHNIDHLTGLGQFTIENAGEYRVFSPSNDFSDVDIIRSGAVIPATVTTDESGTYADMQCEDGDVIEFVWVSGENIDTYLQSVITGVQIFTYPIPMGFFTVKNCSRQASTSIMKVTAYNKLKSDYLDAKANDLIKLVPPDNQSGTVSLYSVLKSTLGMYGIDEKPKQSVNVTVGQASGDYGYSYESISLKLKGDTNTYYPVILTNGARVAKSPDFAETKMITFNDLSQYIDLVQQSLESMKTAINRMVQNPETFYDSIKARLRYFGVEITFRYDPSQMIVPTLYYTLQELVDENSPLNCRPIGELHDIWDPHYFRIELPATLMAYRNISSSQIDAVTIWENSLTLSASIFNGKVKMIDGDDFGSAELISVDVEDLPEVTLRELQSAVYETQCQYGQLDRETDLFSGVELNHSRLLPQETLYPANDLYPGGAQTSATKAMYSKLWADEGNVHKWRYLIITFKGLDEEQKEKEFTLQRTINADGTDDYNMSDNWLFKNLVWTAEQVGAYADAMVLKMQDITWFPFEMWCAGLPYVETGDEIEIPLGQESYTSYILQRQLKGIQNLQDTYINGTLDIF